MNCLSRTKCLVKVENPTSIPYIRTIGPRATFQKRTHYFKLCSVKTHYLKLSARWMKKTFLFPCGSLKTRRFSCAWMCASVECAAFSVFFFLLSLCSNKKKAARTGDERMTMWAKSKITYSVHNWFTSPQCMRRVHRQWYKTHTHTHQYMRLRETNRHGNRM